MPDLPRQLQVRRRLRRHLFPVSNDTAAKLAAQFDQITTSSNHQAQHLLWAMLAMGGLVSAGLTLLIVLPLMRTLTGLIDHLNDGAEQIAAAAGQTSSAANPCRRRG